MSMMAVSISEDFVILILIVVALCVVHCGRCCTCGRCLALEELEPCLHSDCAELSANAEGLRLFQLGHKVDELVGT